jgi:hypothetical protein
VPFWCAASLWRTAAWVPVTVVVRETKFGALLRTTEAKQVGECRGLAQVSQRAWADIACYRVSLIVIKRIPAPNASSKAAAARFEPSHSPPRTSGARGASTPLVSDL